MKLFILFANLKKKKKLRKRKNKSKVATCLPRWRTFARWLPLTVS